MNDLQHSTPIRLAPGEHPDHVLTAALLADQGWPLIAVRRGTKAPGHDGSGLGNHQQHWLTAAAQVLDAYDAGERPQFGIMHGQPSEALDGLCLIVVDVDGGDFDAVLDEIDSDDVRSWARDTLKVSRGAAGRFHLYGLADARTAPPKCLLMSAVEWLAGPGYVMAPGSLHPSGQRYEVVSGRTEFTDGHAPEGAVYRGLCTDDDDGLALAWAHPLMIPDALLSYASSRTAVALSPEDVRARLESVNGTPLTVTGAAEVTTASEPVSKASGEGQGYARVLDALEGLGKRVDRRHADSLGRANVLASCPGPTHHLGDRDPSLKVTHGGDRALICCYGGCTTDDVLAALGLGSSDLYEDMELTVEPVTTTTTTATLGLGPNTLHDGKRIHGAAEAWRPTDLSGVIAAKRAGTFRRIETEVGSMVPAGAGLPAHLFYRGMTNGVAGDSGGGKSWLALAVVAQTLAAGEAAVFLDYETTGGEVVDRLEMLGVSLDAVATHLVYIKADGGRMDEQAWLQFVSMIKGLQPSLIVVDSVGEALASYGLNQDRDDEVASWFDGFIDPLLSVATPCVLLLDHMTKSRDGGLWAIGSQRKRARIKGVQFVLEQKSEHAFSKYRSGKATLICAKDRQGTFERGQRVADMDVTADARRTGEDAPGPNITFRGLSERDDRAEWGDRMQAIRAFLDAHNVSVNVLQRDVWAEFRRVLDGLNDDSHPAHGWPRRDVRAAHKGRIEVVVSE